MYFLENFQTAKVGFYFHPTAKFHKIDPPMAQWPNGPIIWPNEHLSRWTGLKSRFCFLSPRATTRFKSSRELPLSVPATVVGDTLGSSTNHGEARSVALVLAMACPVPQAILSLHPEAAWQHGDCLLYTSDAADE